MEVIRSIKFIMGQLKKQKLGEGEAELKYECQYHTKIMSRDTFVIPKQYKRFLLEKIRADRKLESKESAPSVELRRL